MCWTMAATCVAEGSEEKNNDTKIMWKFSANNAKFRSDCQITFNYSLYFTYLLQIAKLLLNLDN